MRKLPAVLLALPLGELSPQVTERASLLPPQRRAFAESGAANAVSLHDPSRENGIAERPQALRYPEIIKVSSANYGQSASGGHFKSFYRASRLNRKVPGFARGSLWEGAGKAVRL